MCQGAKTSGVVAGVGAIVLSPNFGLSTSFLKTTKHDNLEPKSSLGRNLEHCNFVSNLQLSV